MDDFAPDAMQRLRPHLGALVGEPEEVDGRHPGHADQTFDFAAERVDGRQLAIEVTRAWPEAMMAAGPAWRRLTADVEAAVRQRHPTVTGMHLLNVSLDGNPRAKDYDVGALADAVAQCFDAGLRTDVAVGDAVRITYFHYQPDLAVLDSRGAGEWEGAPESEMRFRRALQSKVGTMSKAGAAGYETHLAIIHWVLGTTHTWRLSLGQNPPESRHPENIWAIDLSTRPSQGRKPAERVWPFA